MSKILVIIVTHNGMKWVEKCLCSVAMSTVKADAFVVDNASTDGTPEWIEENFPGTILVRSKENLGFGAANNIGMKYALEHGYEYAYLLNQDAWLLAGTLGGLLEAFRLSDEAGENFGVLSPMQMSAVPGKVDARFVKWYRISKPITDSGIKEMDFVMAAHWMISRRCLETVGGFSPAFKLYGEDDNWLHRARYHGFHFGAVNSVEAVHDRQNRPDPKERRMRLKCIASVVKVSDPNACLAWRLVRQPLELLGMSVIRWSAIPLKFIPELIKRYKELIALRDQSKRPGAFL